MDQTHIHLLITHLPLFGSLLGSIVLILGLWSKNNGTKMAAYHLFIISAIGASIAFYTGEAAEETVETIQGVNTLIIEDHEDAGAFAFYSMIALGVISLGALYVTYKKIRFSRSIAILVLVVALLSFGLVSRAAWLGGQIRHTEIGTSAGDKHGHHETDDDE